MYKLGHKRGKAPILGMKNVHRGAVIGGKLLDGGMMGAAALGQAELLPEMMVARKVVNGLEKLSK